MKPIRTIYKGFDGFDVAFQGALNPDDIDILDEAKILAEKTCQPVLVEIGPGKVAMHVAETGAKGGYAFRCDTGPLGETWFFKRGLTQDDWNIRVSVKSMPLAVFGLKGVWQTLQEKLTALGIHRIVESIGRVDFAVDFLMPTEFLLKPDCFVAHSNANNTEHSHPLSVQKIADGEFVVHSRGRHASSVTIGKMPGRQIIVYDKLHEVVRKKKKHWFEIWKLNPEEENFPVWRIEIRAGKPHLKNWNVTTFAELEAAIGDLLLSAADTIRYVLEDGNEPNVSRWKISKLWRELIKEIQEIFPNGVSKDIPGKIMTGRREMIRENYLSQMVALLPGLLVSSGYTEKEVEQGLSDIIVNLQGEISKRNRERFNKKISRAVRRLHFI